jgi:hypothetical protein
MKRLIVSLFVLLALCVPAMAQNYSAALVLDAPTDPTTNCTHEPRFWVNNVTNVLWGCYSGAWHSLGTTTSYPLSVTGTCSTNGTNSQMLFVDPGANFNGICSNSSDGIGDDYYLKFVWGVGLTTRREVGIDKSLGAFGRHLSPGISNSFEANAAAASLRSNINNDQSQLFLSASHANVEALNYDAVDFGGTNGASFTIDLDPTTIRSGPRIATSITDGTTTVQTTSSPTQYAISLTGGLNSISEVMDQTIPSKTTSVTDGTNSSSSVLDGALATISHNNGTAIGTVTAAASGTGLFHTDGSQIAGFDVFGGRGLADFTSGAKPACSSSIRRYRWYVEGGAGVADTYEVCMKDAADVYAWEVIATP